MSTIHLSQCPACDSRDVRPLMGVRDHSVSGEQFVIWLCGSCTLRFTQDAPDAASIGRYYKSENYISHTNSSKGFFNSMYQRVRRITLAGKLKLVEKHVGGQGRLLDVGAGVGAFVHHMRQAGWQAEGVEPDAGARANALDNFGISLQTPDALQRFSPGSFDAITLWHVLEHVHHLRDTLKQLRTLLKPGGHLFIAVPNYDSADADTYKTFWAAYDVPRHFYHFSPRAMKGLIEREGMRLAATQPMWWDSFYVSLLSTKYKWGKTRWIGSMITGLKSNLTALINRRKASSVIYIVAVD